MPPLILNVGCPMELELREIINAIRYVLRNGCAWRNLPMISLHGKALTIILANGVNQVCGKP